MGITQFRKLGTKTVPKLLEKVNIIDIVNDLTSGGTGVPLSAEAGKTLKSDLVAEITARQQAFIDLVDGASTGYSTLSKIEATILANETARDAVDSANKSALEQSIADEASARTAADDAIILTVSQNKSALETLISAEASARTAADTILTDDLAQEVLDRQTAISNEITARTNAISAEATARTDADTALSTSIANETTRAMTVEGNLQTAIDAEQARAEGVESVLNKAINNERDQRTSADLAYESRLSAIESGLVAGLVWKASLPSMAELDALVEDDTQSGWAYYVGEEKDVFCVIDTDGGDYQPADWTKKSFLKFADFAEITGMVSAETTRATTAETALAGDIQTETVRATTAEGTLTTNLSNEITRATTAESALQESITAEATERANAIIAEATRATSEEARIEDLVSQEVIDRGTAIANERTRAEGEEARIGGLIAQEILDRTEAINAEQTRATNAETLISSNLSAEVTARTNAISAEVTARTNADNLLADRLNIIEGADTVVGSMAYNLKEAKQWTNDTILTPFVEGMDGNLLVDGDTVTVSHTIANGINGIVFGEVIVYSGDDDQEAVSVNVASVSGSQITLAVSEENEYDGKACKVNYFSRALDDTGAGTGGAGTGAAGA